MLLVERIHHTIGTTRILTDVCMDVAPGELVALCGPNGAGKSTLLNIASGELTPSEGSVSLLDRALDDWPPAELARNRAKLSQESHLTFSFNVREVVEMGRFPHDTPHAHDGVVETCMERVGIAELSDRHYTSLSGGEKQRVHLARVLAQLTDTSDQPKLLLLDEPTSALDLLHQEVALELAHTLCKKHAFAVVVVLHDLNLAAAWSDRIVLMKDGRIHHSGTPNEVLTPPTLKAIYGLDVLVLPHPNTGRPVVTVDRSP